jgi:hypothetical protein
MDTLTRGQAALDAGEQLLEEWVAAGRVRTVAEVADLRGAILDAVVEANEAEGEELERRERGRHWREQLPPDLVEAMLAPPHKEPDEPYWRQRLPGVAEAMLAG